jgi:hypothetical protein
MRLARQRPGDLQAPPLAARQRPGFLAVAFLKARK